MENQSPRSLSIYFDRYAYKEQFIKEVPSEKLGMVITIPCYNEPELTKSLASLAYCHPGRYDVEVIVVINHSEDADDLIKEHNIATYNVALDFAKIYNTEHLIFHIMLEELPAKHAGVGLARKIAMDEAARRLDQVGNTNGVIVCFDADSLCLDNYLLALEFYFEAHQKMPGCSIHFEHPLEGELHPSIYEAIIDYELFLRYYVHALRYAGFPYAYQTIGSSIAVRNHIYQQQGGMNRRKAGEDFYFLHKVIPLGNFGELTRTKVIPSPRQSDRVPFGTGKAVNDWLTTSKLDTYHPNSFKDLHEFYTKLNLVTDYNSLVNNWLNHLPESIIEFSELIELPLNIERIKANSKDLESFKSNFHKWFDGFKILKYVHFARDNFCPNLPIKEACNWLFEIMELDNPGNAKEMLLKMREVDSKLF